MLLPGLVSITFRQLSPRDIVALCEQNGLRFIEWGGDVHVPLGDIQRAREVAAVTRGAGLEVACYGSYYRAEDGVSFGEVLDVAETLGAPVVRVWAGTRASRDADALYRASVAADLHLCAEEAHERGIAVATEWHGGTLTDDFASAQALFAAASHPNLQTLWQPPHHLSANERLEELRAMLPMLSHLHVFHWRGGGKDRRPLFEGADEWRRYVSLLREHGSEVPMLLEFVRGDTPDQLREDAAALHDLLSD